MWERNYNLITWAISALMQEFGRMPTNHEIATKAGLSRQTIHKHLKEYTKELKTLAKTNLESAKKMLCN